MITTLLLTTLLTQTQPMRPPPCFNCVHVSESGLGAKAQATIILKLTIESQHMASIDIEKIHPDVDGIYRLAVKEQITGTPDSYTNTQNILVLDDFGVLDTERIELAFMGNEHIEIEAPEMVALYQYPEGKTPVEIVAMVNARHELKVIEYVARN